MEFATMFFVLKRLDEAKVKLESVNQKDRSNQLRDLQVSLLTDKIADLKTNPLNAMNEEEKRFMLDGSSKFNKACPNYVQTIKRLRERTGLGLGEAKQIVDKYRDEQGLR